MTVHLVKLCVGATSLEDHADWAAKRLAFMRRVDRNANLFHTTRMVPKRLEELLDGGSLYWVIKGQIQARQSILDIEPFTDGEGIKRCHLVLADEIVPTVWQPKRAFQGWRYLKVEDAPADLTSGAADMPGHLKSELADLGLL